MRENTRHTGIFFSPNFFSFVLLPLNQVIFSYFSCLSGANQPFLDVKKPMGLVPVAKSTISSSICNLKGHGNEADFLGFLQKLGPYSSLTLPFEPFRFWLRIRGDIRKRKRLPESASRGVGHSPTRRVGESLTLRLGESRSRRLTDSPSLGVGF
jgi:hypothetical protein